MGQTDKDYISEDRIESYKDYIKDRRKLSYARKPIGQFYSLNHYYNHFITTDKSSNRMFNISKDLYKRILERLVEVYLQNLYLTGSGVLPFKVGKFVIREFEHKPKIVDDKLVYSGPVDWHKTLKLWYDDKEAEKNKVLIRVEPSVKYTVAYTSDKRVLSVNMKYYTGKMVRTITNKINQMAKDGTPPVCYKPSYRS